MVTATRLLWATIPGMQSTGADLQMFIKPFRTQAHAWGRGGDTRVTQQESRTRVLTDGDVVKPSAAPAAV